MLETFSFVRDNIYKYCAKLLRFENTGKMAGFKFFKLKVSEFEKFSGNPGNKNEN